MNKSAKKEPTRIIEFECIGRNQLGLCYPFEKDGRGYLFDGKRVTHAQALRAIAAKSARKEGGSITWDCVAFKAFLRECAGMIEAK